MVVPAGTQHQFINTSKSQPLELVTIYSPAEHDPQTVHKTKEEGDKEEENGKDEAPEWAEQSKDTNEKKGECPDVHKTSPSENVPVSVGLILESRVRIVDIVVVLDDARSNGRVP